MMGTSRKYYRSAAYKTNVFRPLLKVDSDMSPDRSSNSDTCTYSMLFQEMEPRTNGETAALCYYYYYYYTTSTVRPGTTHKFLPAMPANARQISRQHVECFVGSTNRSRIRHTHKHQHATATWSTCTDRGDGTSRLITSSATQSPTARGL